MKAELVKFDELKKNISEFIAPAHAIRVGDFQACAEAVEAQKQIKSYLKRVEDTRKAITDPMNAEIKKIKAYADSIKEPLDRAGAHVQAQLNAFAAAQERVRQEALRKEQEELERKEKELADQAFVRAKAESEAANLFGSDSEDGDPENIFDTPEARLEEAQASLRVEHEQKIFDIRQQNVTNATKTWRCELIDISKVPGAYIVKTLNTSMVLAAARGGVTDIPGVRIFQNINVAIRANTRVPKAALGQKKNENDEL